VSAIAPALLSERDLVRALRDKDERAVEQLIGRFGGPMRRFAVSLVGSGAVADEVVQDTWIAVLRGIERFEGRSSLKTWMFGILSNIARTQAQREGRSIPLSSLGSDTRDEPVVDPSLFQLDGHWVSSPSRWSELPEERLLATEIRGCITRTLESLPEAQRAVMTLRDIEGWTGEDVCEVLGLSSANQRVLLHRARSKVRAALDAELR
jgi:RNA polymerase sigma-70 factor (ECF subfamily)